jgi:hypothetical protein
MYLEFKLLRRERRPRHHLQSLARFVPTTSDLPDPFLLRHADPRAGAPDHAAEVRSSRGPRRHPHPAAWCKTKTLMDGAPGAAETDAAAIDMEKLGAVRRALSWPRSAGGGSGILTDLLPGAIEAFVIERDAGLGQRISTTASGVRNPCRQIVRLLSHWALGSAA